MSASWKTVRVFVSSTFRDMQAERDHLVRFVFPRLRERLLPRRIHLVDVDLRWGVTGEQDVSEVCREVIVQCRPRFLCMLGGRYGTIPEGKGLSVTADEVHFGVLDGRREETCALFYFRCGAVTEQMDKSNPGAIREPKHSAKARSLARLKRDIRAAGHRRCLYRPRWDVDERRLINLNAFGERVAQDILATIDDEFGSAPPAQLDEFAEEDAAMEAFVEERSERFVPGSREPVLEDLLAHASASDGNGYLCLTGAPGTGKSALLAHFSQHPALNSSPSTLFIRHFVGASPGSTDVRRTLRRLCHGLKTGCPDIAAEIPDDLDRLHSAFPDFLRAACSSRRVVLLLDAVNQFDTSFYSVELHWLPDPLPRDARVVLSACDGPVLEGLRRRAHRPQEIELEPLTAADREAIVERFRKRYGKTLDAEQRAALLAKTDAGTPLYLMTALEELRTLGAYDEITRRITELPATTHELFAWILERLESDDGFRDAAGRRVGRELVSGFAALLAASRHGLSQREMVDLLDAGDPQGNVAALLQLLRPYLMRRGELLDFHHGQLRAAAGKQNPQNEMARQHAHRTLAEYFAERTLDPPRQSPGDQSGQVTVQCDLNAELQARIFRAMLEDTADGPREPMQVIMEFHEMLANALGIDMPAAGRLVEALRSAGSAVATGLSAERAEAAAGQLREQGLTAVAGSGPSRAPSPWLSDLPRPFCEMLHHQLEGRLWQAQAGLLAEESFHDRCRTVIGPGLFVGAIRSFAERAALDPEGRAALTNLRLSFPLNEYTRSLLPVLAASLERNLEDVCALLDKCVSHPDHELRAIMGLRAMSGESVPRFNRRPPDLRRKLQALGARLTEARDPWVRWEAVYAYRALAPRGGFLPLLRIATRTGEHPLVRAEAARQLGCWDETSLVGPLLRLGGERHFPLNIMAARSARLIQQSRRMVEPRPIDDWSQPAAFPADLTAALRSSGIDVPPAGRPAGFGVQPLLIHLVRPSVLCLEANWRETELLWGLLRTLPCRLICVESGTRDCSLAFLRKEAGLERRQQLALRFFHDFKMSSEEYLQLATDLDFEIQGIDDREIVLLAIAEKREGRRALELTASVRRAQTMLTNALHQIRAKGSLATVLITSELPGYQISRLLGEESQFLLGMAREAGLSDIPEGGSVFDSLLPETVPPHLVRRPEDFTYLCVRIPEPPDPVFRVDVNDAHSLLGWHTP